MKAKTLIISGLAVVGLGALVAWGFRPDPVPVDLAEIKRGELTVTVNADGKTRIRNIYEVASPITGQAERSPVEVGDRVIAGKTVVAVVRPVAPALLDSRARAEAEAAIVEAEASLRVAASQVTQAQEDLNYAESQLARTTELVNRGVTSLSQLEDATQLRAVKQASLDAAKSNEARASAALARTQAALATPQPDGTGDGNCCVELRAPVDGVVLSIADVSERPVALGAPLVTVGDPQNLEIVADFLSADAVRIAPGSRAIVERWGGTPALEAILRKVEPSAYTKVSALGIEEQRVNAVFDLTSPASARPGLGDGFAVFMRVVVWRGDDVVMVPLSALFRVKGDWVVFRDTAGVAEQVAVTVGNKNSVYAEVLDGLEPGDRVITHPNDTLKTGAVIVDRATLE